MVTQPARSPSQLLGEIIARQTLAYLYQANGGVIGTRETRSFLIQNYFRFGSRYDWGELIQRGTGQSLDPQALVADLAGQP
jgi:Zn-dependent M32 family carboxypeptidase